MRKEERYVSISLNTAYEVYERLAKTDKKRQKRDLALFKKELAEYTLEKIRDSVDRSWVLGSEKFKKQVADETERSVESAQKKR